MEKTANSPQFRIPLELLKAFQADIRFVPAHLPVNGWIIFDMEMLASVLRRGDAKAGAVLADHLDALRKANGQLVILEKTAER